MNYAWQRHPDHSQSSRPSCVKPVALPNQKEGEQRKQILALIFWLNYDLEK